MTAVSPADVASDARPTTREGRMWDRALSYWLLSYKRTWRGSVFSGFLSPLFFLAAMGFGLSQLIDRGGEEALGVPYLAFIAPGVLAATAMQTAVGESTWTVMGAIKWQRQYHAMLAAPLGVTDVLVGHLVYVAFRVAITSAVFLAVAGALGALLSWWAVLALPVVVICGMAFAAPVFAFAAKTESDSGFNVLFRFIVMPLFLFSWTFFPVSQLPAFLQPVAWVTPLWHGVEASRALSLGEATVPGVAGHVVFMLVWVAGGVLLARWSFRSRLVV
jgi:lipooligosaccharide transport system permease protein